MANVIAPFGLAPERNLGSSVWNQQVTRYWIPSSDGSQYNIGDAVKSAEGCDVNGVAKIAKAAAGNTLRGVIVAFDPNFNNLNTIIVPATKTQDYYAYVVDDPNVEFSIQDDGAGSPATTWVGQNANIVVANPTSPVPTSGTTLGGASVNTTASLQLKIIGGKLIPQSVGSANTIWLVRINNHEFGNITAGV